MPRAKGLPSWVYEPLVSCEGGPFAGQWFLAEDWEQKLRATGRMQELTPDRHAPTLDYVKTKRVAEHPVQPAASTVWIYRPKEK